MSQVCRERADGYWSLSRRTTPVAFVAMTLLLLNDQGERVVDALRVACQGMRIGLALLYRLRIKWHPRWCETGSLRPRPQGGDKRSHQIESYRDEILTLVDERSDMTPG